MAETSRTPLARRDFLICCLLVCCALLTIASFTFAMYTVKEFSNLKVRVSEIEQNQGNMHLLFPKSKTSIEDSAKSVQVRTKDEARNLKKRTASSDLPPPPKIISVTRIVNISRAINVSWTPDLGSNTDIKHFVLEFKVQDGKWIKIYTSKTVRFFILQNVDNSKTYFFKMFALNDVGRGSSSAVYIYKDKGTPKVDPTKSAYKKRFRLKKKQAISIHLHGKSTGGSKSITTDPITNWQVEHKLGSISYTNGNIIVNVPGIYFIYSQLQISGHNSYTHKTYINGKTVLRRFRHYIGRVGKYWESSYQGAGFPLKKGDRVSVGGPAVFQTLLENGYFGAVLLSRIKHLE